jgi:poly-gamma-glutamate synthesis protein (capsule biosynthesis protein)
VSGDELRLVLCGDVMTGRGIDQILPHPCDPELYEPAVASARHYVDLAEAASGPIPRRVGPEYPWGEARAVFADAAPHLVMVNLETSVTRHPHPWPEKAVHYRTSPENAACLVAGGITCCALANNHVLDWGYRGLLETLDTLDALGIQHAGAGRNLAGAEAPAIVKLPDGERLLVYALCHASSGVPWSWAAAHARPGVALLEDLSDSSLRRVRARIRRDKREGDRVIASVHWGGNWGFAIPREQQEFARALVEQAGVDVVHGHSSHHVKAIEVYRERLILYGCGDLLDDYEGIAGHEAYRGDVGAIYLARLAASGALVDLTLVPTRVQQFRIRRASEADAEWLAATLRCEGARFGTRVHMHPERKLELEWGVPAPAPASA